jgi:hypothetical protein
MVPRKSTTLSKLLVPSVALYRCSSAELAPAKIALVVGSIGLAGQLLVAVVATAAGGAITVGAGDRL